MAKMKKVVLLIVEGFSEEALLFERLHEMFNSFNIHFEVQRGDILFIKDNRRNIKATVGNVVNKTLQKRKFKKSDILAVLHIVDTDGCFITNNHVVVNNEQKKNTVYSDNKISVKNEGQKCFIEGRNVQRSRNINIMSTTAFVSKSIPYYMYYFSIHLEHVLFNERHPEKDDKTHNVEKFLEKLETPIEKYLKNYLPQMNSSLLEDQYIQSWQIVKQDLMSLSRLTNVPLLFKYLEQRME